MKHMLKTWPQFWLAVHSGAKKFEVRKNDRNFQVNDSLELVLYDPDEDKLYEGVLIRAMVTYALPITGGYVVMSIDTYDWTLYNRPMAETDAIIALCRQKGAQYEDEDDDEKEVLLAAAPTESPAPTDDDEPIEDAPMVCVHCGGKSGLLRAFNGEEDEIQVNETGEVYWTEKERPLEYVSFTCDACQCVTYPDDWDEWHAAQSKADAHQIARTFAPSEGEEATGGPTVHYSSSMFWDDVRVLQTGLEQYKARGDAQ